MLFWFVGTAVMAVWLVFRDTQFDYRLLIVGAALPAGVVELFGWARALHSVSVSVTLLVVVMLVTSGRKPIRRTLLGLPVGTMLHLVFAGAWTNTTVFWWPFFGFAFGDASRPIAARGWWNVLLELIGIALVWHIVKSTGLQDADRRQDFRTSGRLTFAPA